MANAEAKQIEKVDWQFDWLGELKDKTKEIYKLTTVNNPTNIQELVSIEDKQDHVFMHLIESAKLTREKITFILVYPGILLHKLAKSWLTKVLTASLLLMQNRYL